VRRGVAASDDRKRDAAQLRAPPPRSATALNVDARRLRRKDAAMVYITTNAPSKSSGSASQQRAARLPNTLRRTAGSRKNRTFATVGRCIKSTCSSPWSKASGFETRKLAAILAADIVGRLTGADKDRTLASRPRYYGAGPLAMTPRLVRTNQSPPRFSIRKTRPAPGMVSPGATSCGPERLSTNAMPSRTFSTL
jgi:hypothetical protein